MPNKLTDIAPGAIERSGGTDDGTAPHGAKPPPLPAWRYAVDTAKRLSDAGEYAKALATLEGARRRYAKNEEAVAWIKHRKALLHKLTDIAPGAIERSGGTDDGTAPHGAKPKPPPLPVWRYALDTAKRLSDAGEYAKALATLEEARRRYAKHEEAVAWIKYRKALLLLKTEGLEGARELAMEALDSPIPDRARMKLRWEVIAKMSDAGDVDGLAKLLPDYYLYVEDISRERQIVKIAKRHGLFFGSPQTVLSERRISYSIPAKPRYPTSIEQALSGYGPVCRSPEVKLHTLTNCTAVFAGSHKFFFDADGGFIRECSDPLLAFLNERIKDLLKDYPPPGGRDIPGVSAFIGDRFRGGNYCHWLLDWLPRLSLCEHAGPFENIVCNNRVRHDFMAESLAFLGYSDRTVIEAAARPVWRFEKLLVPDSAIIGTLRHPMQLCHPDLIGWWRSRLPVRKPRRKLYIPRTNKRVVQNETELVNLLDSFEVFDPGRHSFEEQIEAFSEAEAVVGAHGAGLTNILFAPEGCRVLELFPPRGGTAAFACLANALNHDYDLAIEDDGGPPSPMHEREPNHLDFHAPLEQVAQWLRSMA